MYLCLSLFLSFFLSFFLGISVETDIRGRASLSVLSWTEQKEGRKAPREGGDVEAGWYSVAFGYCACMRYSWFGERGEVGALRRNGLV